MRRTRTTAVPASRRIARPRRVIVIGGICLLVSPLILFAERGRLQLLRGGRMRIAAYQATPAQEKTTGEASPAATVASLSTAPPTRSTSVAEPLGWAAVRESVGTGLLLFVAGLQILVVALQVRPLVQSHRWRPGEPGEEPPPPHTPHLPPPHAPEDMAIAAAETSRAAATPHTAVEGGIVAYVTRSRDLNWGAGSENKDCGLVMNGEGYQLVAVADGVSGASHAAIAAEAVVNAFRHAAPGWIVAAERPIVSVVTEFYDALPAAIARELRDAGVPGAAANTTFLGLVASSSQYVVTYLGDGVIFEVALARDQEGVPFKAVSHLLSPSPTFRPAQVSASGRSGTPEIRTVARQRPTGALWILATDGMNDLERWGSEVKGEEAAVILADDLWQRFRENPAAFDGAAAEDVLRRWLMPCQDNDDATIAVLLSAELLESWHVLAAPTATNVPQVGSRATSYEHAGSPEGEQDDVDEANAGPPGHGTSLPS